MLQKMEKWEPYIYYRASTGSVYISFNNKEMGCLRVSDHAGRKKYKYRWILDVRKENKNKFEIYTYKGVKRCAFGYNAIDKFILFFERQVKICKKD